MSTSAAGSGPVPQGLYVPARRHGGLIFTSGMTPRRDGVLQFTGPIPRGAVPADFQEAVELASSNALMAARGLLAAGERIAAIVSLTVYVAAQDGFTAHSQLADFASRFLEGELGPEGIGSRAAVGVATLPGNAPVEIQMIAAT